MLDESDVRAALEAALATGGDWAEVYADRRDSTTIRIEDHRVEELTSGRDQGAGRRVAPAARSRPGRGAARAAPARPPHPRRARRAGRLRLHERVLQGVAGRGRAGR